MIVQVHPPGVKSALKYGNSGSAARPSNRFSIGVVVTLLTKINNVREANSECYLIPCRKRLKVVPS